MAQATASRGTLLTDAPVAPTLTTRDLDRCVDFYTNTLGIPCTERQGDAATFTCGNGTELYVYVRDEPPKATNTVASFRVNDLEQTAEALRNNGVTFEEYDLPGIKTVNGIASHGDWKAAWLKDPDGNILAIGTN